MPPLAGNLIVIVILAVIVGLAIRSIYRSHKTGGCGCGCEGCTRSCAGCGKAATKNTEKRKA